MTVSSPQPQIRTVHQLQNLWKNAIAIRLKIPSSSYIKGFLRKKQFKMNMKKNWHLYNIANVFNIIKTQWKPTIPFQSSSKMKLQEISILKSPTIKSTKTSENNQVIKSDQGFHPNTKVEFQEVPVLKSSLIKPTTAAKNDQVIEFDKALTDWLNDDKTVHMPKAMHVLPKAIDTTNTNIVKTTVSKMNIEKNQLTEWLQKDKMQYFKFPSLKNWSSVQKDEKSVTTGIKIAKDSIQNRSRFLVKSLLSATSETSKIYRLQEMYKHILNYPEEKNTMIKENAVTITLKLRESSSNSSSLKEQAQEVLCLLGYADPPGGTGIRILSIDGGGIRGLMSIEVLRYLEKLARKPVHQIFDYVCGVSTGAILTMLVVGLKLPLDECEEAYVKMSNELFKRSVWSGTSGLIWSHSYYDTNMWVNMLRNLYGNTRMSETSRKRGNPKISVVSAVMNQPLLQPFLFRNYALPYRAQSLYPGSSNHKVWQAIRASAAAPGYFEQYHLDGIVHQDGGLIMNNPTALAVHEAKLLWPKEKIQCVISLGNGRYVPAPHKISTSTSLSTLMMKIVDSATDTESFHIVLQDHLPSNTYYRMNPYMTERISLDETRTEKLEQLKNDARKYIEWNEEKIQKSINAINKPRTHLQKTQDWVKLQHSIL